MEHPDLAPDQPQQSIFSPAFYLSSQHSWVPSWSTVANIGSMDGVMASSSAPNSLYNLVGWNDSRPVVGDVSSFSGLGVYSIPSSHTLANTQQAQVAYTGCTAGGNGIATDVMSFHAPFDIKMQVQDPQQGTFTRPQVHGRCEAAEIVTLAFENQASQSVASNGHASDMTAAAAVFHATQPGAISHHAHDQRQPSHARGARPPTASLRACVSCVLK